jgi:ubiquinone/menaquinone biosynthesis C-methylase UbiE
MWLPPANAQAGDEGIEMSDNRAVAFKGTLAELYDCYLVPMLFEPYAGILSDRVDGLGPSNILELAAGTGVLTQLLARNLPPGATITATDLSQPMLDIARTKSGTTNVVWQQADAMKLPFMDDSFDLVVCQFGVMFFPDKQASFREVSRVLRPGGRYMFVLWDNWKQMPAAPLAIAADVVGELLDRDPSSLVNPPYHDERTILADLASARFERVNIERITQPAEATSAREAAIVTVHGSLIRTVIESTAPERFDESTDAVERAMQSKFGDGRIAGSSTALMITAEKPLP